MNGLGDHARGWMVKGDHDLANARLILHGNGSLDTVCFLCQQAAEKYLKALVALSGETIPHTHNLAQILDVCRSEFPRLGLATKEVAFLTDYAVELRYDLSFAPDRPEAEHALKAAEKVRREVLALLPPEAHPREPLPQ